MKRRYKAGDWIRVPLGGQTDAIALIARACRSRLFGYFFALPVADTPTHDWLRSLRADDAIAALLFGGAPIEEARWPIVATSLPFDRDAWPFPLFAARGAFGEAWTQVRYDPQTLQIVERRAIDTQGTTALADARFAHAHEVEALLRRRIAGESAPRVQSVVEVRSPIDAERLQAVQHGGRIQYSTRLTAVDLDVLASFIEIHPQVRLRVHGFRAGFDATQLERLAALHDLTLDVHRIQHVDALGKLSALRALRLGSMQLHLEFLQELTQLRDLALHGTRATLAPLQRLAQLQSLTLENTPPVDLSTLAGAPTLETLVLAHGDYRLQTLVALKGLRSLELRALETRTLSVLRALSSVERLTLHGLSQVTDLRPIAALPALRELRIRAMPQLNVHHFEPLQACAGLRVLEVDVGSRTKTREIHRLMQRGNTQ